ncbi:conserved Plasmodium protein, unknown function [Plasmodium malariae]|uniref:Proteasome activator complex subunit 4 C-terminal domain-containing protein n=1 Tax=Plasmodium malariae TaxID=5858 RepID=A0A1C3L2J2_PLAMA|nr:conserved Plasmodium protein, unknown function [Plasmodium malariae]
MLNILRELNDYSKFLPKKIKENVNKEKYDILSEIKKIACQKKNNSYNVTTVIKLFNSFETINTTKCRSFHFYIFMIKYLWHSLQNKSISPNLKSYICQTISSILKNIKKYILDDFFFEYDRELILKDEQEEAFNWKGKEKGNDSDITNNSYENMSEHCYDEYKNMHEVSDMDSSNINENKVQNILVNDAYYISFNGIFEKTKNYGPFFNEDILINGKNESFRLYIQKCILDIIDYKYLFNVLYNYLSNNFTKHDEYSHNTYKNYIGSLLNVLVNLRLFCYYNIDVHNLLVDFSLNNMYSIKYEDYIDKRETCFREDTNYFERDSMIFLINKKLNEKVSVPLKHNNSYEETSCCTDMNDYVIGKEDDEFSNIDKSVCSIGNLEICIRYNTIFLNFVMLNQLSSDDLCFKLIKYNKILYFYKKIKRFNWHSINYAFVKIIYKGLRYAYIYNMNLEKEMREILNILFFLFLFYIKLPSSVQLNSSKYFIPDEYTILINDNDSVIKVISKIFVFLLNRKYKKETAKGEKDRIRNKEREKELLNTFLTNLNERNFNLTDIDENKGEDIFAIFENIDTHDFLNIITSLFMPHIHPSNVGKHIGNINLFINSFLYCFIRKMKREDIYLKKLQARCNEEKGNRTVGTIPNGNEKEQENNMNDYITNYFISEEDKNFVVEKFIMLAVQGMFPKSNKGVSLFENILKHICIIDINCLDIFVKKIMECLFNVNTSTQICNCLLSLCLLLPLLIKQKATYLKDILYVMNMGIDICDIYKSFTIFSFLSILFSYIPIVKFDSDISGSDYLLIVKEYNKYDKFVNCPSDSTEKNDIYKWKSHQRKEVQMNDEQIKGLITERKELVDYLCYWVHDFFDKILYFIKFTKNEKSKDSKKNNGDNKDNKIENDIYVGLKATIISLFIHLDHSILYELCHKFLNNIEQENAKALSIIPYAMGLVNSKKIFDTLFNAFYKKLITKKKKKKSVENVLLNDKQMDEDANGKGHEEEFFVYTKNEYANDDTIKCYLQFLSSLIRRAKNEFLNVEDIYNLVQIYLVEDNNTIFKYVCKIIYRFLENNFSLTIKDFSCFQVKEKMSSKDKILTLAHWGIPWHLIINGNGNKSTDEGVLEGASQGEMKDSSRTGAADGCVGAAAAAIPTLHDSEELVKWKIPSQENVKVGKEFTYFILDYLINLLIQCDIPIFTPNLAKYIEIRKLREKKINWKFTLNYSNVISRIYKGIKSVIKPLSFLYPDERYNYSYSLTKCHVINTKLSFYFYIYASEIVITLSLHVLRIPKEILNMSSLVHYNSNDEKIEHKSSISSVNSENSVNGLNTKVVDKKEMKKLKDEFFTNVINNKEKDIKADAKIQRKIIKNIHFLLLKCNENANSSMYNEYINNVLSFTYNIYPYSYNYDIIKSQYINNIFYLFNERLKQRKKNYCFRGFREQLCNILFFINLSIYSQVRSYAQSTIKLILPSFKIVKVPFLKICAFYLKNYIKLYTLTKGAMEYKDRHTKNDVREENDINGDDDDYHHDNGNANSSVNNNVNNNDHNGAHIGQNQDDDLSSKTQNDRKIFKKKNDMESGSFSKLSSLRSLNDLNNNDYFENKCISCFNGIIINITNNSGLVKKISTDIYLLKKYIKIVIKILRLEIQKEDITFKCMKLVYALINGRFIKNNKEQKKKKKKMNELFLFLIEESEKKNNVYAQIVILSFFICFSNFVLQNYAEFYFNYLLENISIKKNVHVYNLAFCGFIKLLKYFNNNKDKGLIPAYITKVFKSEKTYKNFVDICIYKNLKSKKKSNSVNAIIINLSKIQKSFKGFVQISETHIRDFFYYYVFFKFLVNLQNACEQEGEVEAIEAGEKVGQHEILMEQYEKQTTSNLEKTKDRHCTNEEISRANNEGATHKVHKEDVNVNGYRVNKCSLKYIGIMIPILKELQMDVLADNEYKATFISLVCPLLLALRKLKKKEDAEEILVNIIILLEKEIALVNVEVFNIWIYYFHLLFINIKKKYIHIYDRLFKFCLCFHSQDISNLIFKKKIQLLNIMLIYSIHKNINLMDSSIMEFLKLIDNDNITVRQIVGDLLSYLLYILHDHKHYSHLKYMYYNILLYLYKVVTGIIEYLQSNEIISKQCTQIYALETLAYLTITMFTNRCMYVLNNLSILFLKMFILSVQLVDNFINGIVNKAINCFLCPSLYLFRFELINYQSIKDQINCQIFPSEQIELIDLFDSLLNQEIGVLIIQKLSDLLSKNNWKIRNSALQYCFYFHSYYCIFMYSKKENSFLLNVFLSFLVDNYIEIQNLSRDILSSVFCYYDSLTLQKISNYFLDIANQKVILDCSSHENNAKIVEKKKTVAIYTLISIVNSFPNYVPEWLPHILISVAKMSRTTLHIIKKEIEKCIQNFLRTHKDEWEYKYKLVFTEDQLNIMDMYKGGLNYFT